MAKGGAGGFMIMGVIVAIITVAIGSAIGLALVGKTDTVTQGLGLSEASGGPEQAFNNTVSTIYSSWPLLGIVVLALIGAAALLAISIFR